MTETSIMDLPGFAKLMVELDNEIRELDPTHTSRQLIQVLPRSISLSQFIHLIQLARNRE